MLNLTNLKPNKGAVRKKKRVGRGLGSGKGTYSGRGIKGAGARSGKEKPPYFEGGQTPLYRRVPKRGFHNPFKKLFVSVNLKTLERKFQSGDTITPRILREKKIIKRKLPVKILGNGEISKPLILKVHSISKSAKEKIEKKGGKVEIINK